MNGRLAVVLALGVLLIAVSSITIYYGYNYYNDVGDIGILYYAAVLSGIGIALAVVSPILIRRFSK